MVVGPKGTMRKSSTALLLVVMMLLEVHSLAMDLRALVPVSKGKAQEKPVDPSRVWPNRPEDLESCMGCKYVLKLMEQRLGNTYEPESMQNTFHSVASYAEQTNIFHPAVASMRDNYATIRNMYMDQRKPGEICSSLQMCAAAKKKAPAQK